MPDYIGVSVANDEYKCAISVSVSALSETLSGFDKISIMRRKNGTQNYTTLYERTVATIADATFNALDILAVSGTAYDYSVVVKNGDTVVETHSESNVLCDFTALFLGNFSSYYIGGLNASTETDENTECEYVKTLAGRYPYRVSNSAVDYVTGTTEGLFLPLTSDRKRFEPDSYHSYTDEILAFLKDKTSKIIKTYDGKIYYVCIDNKLKRVNNEGYKGMNKIQFSWTEIGSVPSTGMYIEPNGQ